MSEDIEKGAAWFDTLRQRLDDADVGILCLTPENVSSEWLTFELGALSMPATATNKAYPYVSPPNVPPPKEKRLVCPYLCGGLRKSDITAPLAHYQVTTDDKPGTQALFRDINGKCARPLDERSFDEIFDAFWPKLEEALKDVPPSAGEIPHRADRQLLDDILELVRADSVRVAETARTLEQIHYAVIQISMKQDSQGRGPSAPGVRFPSG